MIKNSIFFYTNNVIPRGVLTKTLSECITLVEKNEDTELIITSHYPVTRDFVEVQKDFENFKTEALHPVICTTNVETSCDRVHAYVVGDLPQCIKSIVLQQIFSLDQAKGENIIMMEHDVLYPRDYLKETVAVLDKGCDFACTKNHVLFSFAGFSKGIHTYHLSRFSGKKYAWKEFYHQVLADDSNQVEPRLAGLDEIGNSETFLEYDNYETYNTKFPVLDISHGLNTTGKPFSPDIYDYDGYWGDKSEILCLFDQDYVDFIEGNRIFQYGLHSVS